MIGFLLYKTRLQEASYVFGRNGSLEMLKYRYEFMNGDSVEVEVTEDMLSFLIRGGKEK